jgi:hypothetical protein
MGPFLFASPLSQRGLRLSFRNWPFPQSVLGVGLFLLISSPGAASPPSSDPATRAVVDGVSQAALEKTVRTLAAFPTRHTLSSTGSAQAADWIAGQFQAISQASGGRLRVERDTWTQPAGDRLPAPVSLTNVVATLPGDATPERIIIISGHYDSRVTDVMNATGIAPGANDDASGVAITLELARLMAQHHYAATIKFVAVTGEEQGLYGSTHLAQEMADGKSDVEAMITNDIVGNSQGQGVKRDDTYVRVFAAGFDPTETLAQTARRRSAGTDADTPARTLARAVLDTARRYTPGFGVTLVYRLDRYLRGGDHEPFVERGYPAVRFTEPHEDWRHQHQDVRIENGVQYGDLPQFVDYHYLARVARLNAATVATLAAAPSPPLGVTLKADLSPTTTLSWDQSPDASAYEVLWRPTDAADWQGTRMIEHAGTITLPLSKDDYLFAVRTVSASGDRSLPTIPIPAR